MDQTDTDQTLVPCTLCGTPTDWACSDCAIDSVIREERAVCASAVCKDRHDTERCTRVKDEAGVAVRRVDAGIAAVLAGKRRSTVVAGDCIDVLKTMPEASVDAVVTDPPYGLSDEPDATAVLHAWLAGERYEHGKPGFMQSKWDALCPGPEAWREAYRVLKPGGHLLAFAGTRSWDLMSMAIRLAGFENRDTIRVDGPPALGWRYGQGLSHGKNVGKAIDKVANAVPDAVAKWEGWNTHLKPSWEVILLFRKPLSESTVAANILQHGTGALNIGACRVGFAGPEDERESKEKNQHANFGNGARDNHVYGDDAKARDNYEAEGRWPPNTVIVHDPNCQLIGTKRVSNSNASFVNTVTGSVKPHNIYGKTRRMEQGEVGYADADGMEEVADWRCVEGCAARVLDAQSGDSVSRVGKPRASAKPGDGWGMTHTGAEYSDAGGASRFVPQFATDEPDAPFLYEAKAPSRERFLYCRVCRDAFPVSAEQRHAHGKTNSDHISRHPTQKPLGLMRMLTRLCVAKDGVVLDPFCGSGTTGVACAAERFRFIGIDLDPEYVRIAQHRIEADSPLFAYAERATTKIQEASETTADKERPDEHTP